MVDGGDHLDLPGALRALRRRADLSQRELAVRSGVPSATIGSVESGASPNPAFRTMERLVTATGARLAILDPDGSEPVAPDTDDHLDRAYRRLPAHLDPHWVTWRGARRLDRWGFVRDRRDRDRYRRRKAHEARGNLDYQIRRLGPGDAAVLETLRTDARELDLAGRAAPDRPAPTIDEAALLGVEEIVALADGPAVARQLRRLGFRRRPRRPPLLSLPG